MPENLKKLTDQIKSDLSSKVADGAFADLIAKTKAANDATSGTFKVVISTDNVDRQGDVVLQNGWDLSFYKMNPVVLWGHDYSSLPIGTCTNIYIEGGKLVAEGKFAPEDCNPFAQNVRRLYDAGFVKTTSVGFIPKEFDDTDRSKITKAELLEFSFVPVPANPYALTMRQITDLKLDTKLMMTKGVQVEVKEEVPPAPVPPADAPKDEPVKPAEEVPPAPPADAPKDGEGEKAVKTEKGDVTEELARIQMNQEKGQKTQPLWSAVDAFFSAYYDENTPVEDFGQLLNEFADICKSIAGGTVAAKDIADQIAKMAGNRPSLKNIIQSMSVLARGEDGPSSNGGGDTVVDPQKPADPANPDTKEVDEFIFTRGIAKDIVNILSLSLEKFNQRHRARSISNQKP